MCIVQEFESRGCKVIPVFAAGLDLYICFNDNGTGCSQLHAVLPVLASDNAVTGGRECGDNERGGKPAAPQPANH